MPEELEHVASKEEMQYFRLKNYVLTESSGFRNGPNFRKVQLNNFKTIILNVFKKVFELTFSITISAKFVLY